MQIPTLANTDSQQKILLIWAICLSLKQDYSVTRSGKGLYGSLSYTQATRVCGWGGSFLSLNPCLHLHLLFLIVSFHCLQVLLGAKHSPFWGCICMRKAAGVSKAIRSQYGGQEAWRAVFSCPLSQLPVLPTQSQARPGT